MLPLQVVHYSARVRLWRIVRRRARSWIDLVWPSSGTTAAAYPARAHRSRSPLLVLDSRLFLATALAAARRIAPTDLTHDQCLHLDPSLPRQLTPPSGTRRRIPPLPGSGHLTRNQHPPCAATWDGHAVGLYSMARRIPGSPTPVARAVTRSLGPSRHPESHISSLSSRAEGVVKHCLS